MSVGSVLSALSQEQTAKTSGHCAGEEQEAQDGGVCKRFGIGREEREEGKRQPYDSKVEHAAYCRAEQGAFAVLFCGAKARRE